MQGKAVRESSIVMSYIITPQDVNWAGNVHGGVVMKLIDTVAAVVASRHTHANVVTASIDRLDFHHPIYAQDIVMLKASLNYVGKTSMEVGVRVETESILTGELRHTSSAYLTFVALDKEGRPLEAPPLLLETEEERRRNREALSRREIRLRERKGKES